MDHQELEQRITFEAVAPHFDKMREWAVFTVIVPLTVVGVMWQQIDRLILLGWLFLVILGIGARYLLTSEYRKRNIHFRNAQPWHRLLLALSIYLGATWIIAVFAFFVEDSAPHQVFMITLAVTLGIGSISAGTHWFPLFFWYGLPILAALAIRLALLDSFAYQALAVMMLATLLAAYTFARKLNSIVRSEMRLHYESEDLARNLAIKSKEAEEAVYAKSRILATASHDCRQPLHALSLFVDALKETGTPDERKRIYDRIEISLSALRKMFDALFDMSRLDANVVQPELCHFDIAHCLADLEAEYRDAAQRRNLHLRVHARPLIVLSDRALLERILRNLISNALRYTRTGGVLISARQHHGKVLVQVWDTGIGIPRESQEHAFAEFQRLQNTRQDEEKGLGFGLAIVQRLCELLDYPLTLRSEVGKGSVFSLEVPSGDTVLATTCDDPEHDFQDHLGGENILVIDNDTSILNAMETLLSRWGFRVLTAESFDAGIQLLTSTGQVPDMVLSDFTLGGRDNGLDVIARLKARFGEAIPGILITGTTNPEELQLIEKSGIRMVQKPVRPSHLRSLIQHQLATS